MRAGPFSTCSLRPPSTRIAGFTLAEVLAALLFMAIVIPVAMQGVSVASRAGIMGQRKAQAIRIAERILDENLVTGQLTAATGSGTVEEGDTSFPWTLTSEPWTEESMSEVTVRVTFEVQGNTFDISVSTLFDVSAATGGTGTETSA